jgi:predicted nucleic acid-binding protein
VRVVLDTNILIRLASPGDAQRDAALNAVVQLVERGHLACITPQSYYEYWVVATRPREQNGLGLPCSQATADLSRFDVEFALLDDSAGTLSALRELIAKYSVTGKLAHDARLVAAMLQHGVTYLLTFNTRDFARYSEITAFDPSEVDRLASAQ